MEGANKRLERNSKNNSNDNVKNKKSNKVQNKEKGNGKKLKLKINKDEDDEEYEDASYDEDETDQIVSNETYNRNKEKQKKEKRKKPIQEDPEESDEEEGRKRRKQNEKVIMLAYVGIEQGDQEEEDQDETIEETLDETISEDGETIPHSDNDPFRCEFCHYRSFRRSDLVRHERTHASPKPYNAGEKPYACQLCDYRCAQLSHLQTHERTHSEIPYDYQPREEYRPNPMHNELKNHQEITQTQAAENPVPKIKKQNSKIYDKKMPPVNEAPAFIREGFNNASAVDLGYTLEFKKGVRLEAVTGRIFSPFPVIEYSCNTNDYNYNLFVEVFIVPSNTLNGKPLAQDEMVVPNIESLGVRFPVNEFSKIAICSGILFSYTSLQRRSDVFLVFALVHYPENIFDNGIVLTFIHSDPISVFCHSYYVEPIRKDKEFIVQTSVAEHPDYRSYVIHFLVRNRICEVNGRNIKIVVGFCGLAPKPYYLRMDLLTTGGPPDFVCEFEPNIKSYNRIISASRDILLPRNYQQGPVVEIKNVKSFEFTPKITVSNPSVLRKRGLEPFFQFRFTLYTLMGEEIACITTYHFRIVTSTNMNHVSTI
jgi:hypothetical protein